MLSLTLWKQDGSTLFFTSYSYFLCFSLHTKLVVVVKSLKSIWAPHFLSLCMLLIIQLLTSGSDSFCIAQKGCLSVTLSTKIHCLFKNTDSILLYHFIINKFLLITMLSESFLQHYSWVFHSHEVTPWTASTPIQSLTMKVSEPTLAWATCGRLSFQRNAPTIYCTVVTHSHL